MTELQIRGFCHTLSHYVTLCHTGAAGRPGNRWGCSGVSVGTLGAPRGTPELLWWRGDRPRDPGWFPAPSQGPVCHTLSHSVTLCHADAVGRPGNRWGCSGVSADALGALRGTPELLGSRGNRLRAPGWFPAASRGPVCHALSRRRGRASREPQGFAGPVSRSSRRL